MESPYTADQLAELPQRAAAFVLDFFFSALGFIIALFSVALMLGEMHVHIEETGIAFVVLVWASFWEVLWVCTPSRGKPGQRMLGFRITLIDGQPLRPGRAVMRAVIRTITYAFGPFMIIGNLFTIGGSERNQAVHDLLSGTIAVRSAHWRHPNELPTTSRQAAEAAGEQPVATAQPEPSRAHHEGPFL